jgi:hypothetical protein
MNEIDPSTNGLSSTENQHQQEVGLGQSANKSPLLSSLLTSSSSASSSSSPSSTSALSSKHETISNGQQDKSRNAHGFMMPSPAGTGPSAIVTNPQYHEEASAAFIKRVVASPVDASSPEQVDLSSTNNSHKRYNNLNDILQRNNNNNKVASSEATSTPSKSILENCLLKPSTVKSQHYRLESQFYHNNKMNESEYHTASGTSSSSANAGASVLKFAHQPEESRKVEPLKINLNREPIRTVIKLPQTYDNNSSSSSNSPTKITIKPPQPPPINDRNNSVITSPSASISISPTLSSSSLSSESSYENMNDSQQRSSSIQVVPKLHLRTPLNHEQSELHIVPKLTITGINSPQTSAMLQSEQQARDHNSLNNSVAESPAIPKLTLKKDNNTNEGFYHLNHDAGNAIPKLHIKTNHLHHHHHNAQKDVKLTIKPIVEQPPVPKLTIKTTDNDTMTVVNSVAVENEQAIIPKLTIKANQQSVTPKLTIKPVVPPPEPDIVQQQQPQQQEESIPKLTLKAINNSSNFEKVVPKLVVKLPKEAAQPEHESSSCSSTPSPPPLVPKLNIKPIKEVPKQPPTVKNCTESVSPQSDTTMKFSINRLIGAAAAKATVEKEEEEDERELQEITAACKPLEINTSVIKSADSGQDSPRIILKINKTNNESITTEIIPQTTDSVQKSINHNKRTHSNDNAENEEEHSKKPKLTQEDDDDVIIINDSDASSEANSNQMKNHQPAQVQEAINAGVQSPPKNDEGNKVNPLASTRSLRQSRRTTTSVQKEPVVTKAQLRKQKQQQQQQLQEEVQPNNVTPPAPQEQENSQPAKEDLQISDVMDPLALSNDGSTINSSSVDELITPKRGRGRPKKITQAPPPERESESRDPLELSSATNNDNSSQENSQSDVNEIAASDKRTPGIRGRGRGRGRLKRTVEVMKNGKPIQITLEGHDDDDSPSFSLYNRSLRGGFSGGKRSKVKSIRGKGSKSSPFLTPERSKDGNFMTPNANSDVKVRIKEFTFSLARIVSNNFLIFRKIAANSSTLRHCLKRTRE